MTVQMQIDEICEQFVAKHQDKLEPEILRTLAHNAKHFSDLYTEAKMQTALDRLADYEKNSNKAHQAQMEAMERVHRAQMESLKDSINSLKWFILAGFGVLSLAIAFATFYRPQQSTQNQPPVQQQQVQPQVQVQPVQPQQTVRQRRTAIN